MGQNNVPASRLHRPMSYWAVVFSISLLLVPMFPTRGMQAMWGEEWLHLLRLWNGVAFIVAVAIWASRSRIANAPLMCALGFNCVVLLSTVLCDGSLKVWWEAWLPCCTAVILAAGMGKSGFLQLLYAVFGFTFVLSGVNAASMLLYPGGMVDVSVYFLENRNAVFSLIFPCLGGSLLIDCMRGVVVSARSCISFILSLTQVLLGGSATSLIALIVFSGSVLLILLLQRSRGILTGWTFVSASLVASFLIVVLRVHHCLGFIVSGLLGKSLTLSGRDQVWDKVFSLIGGDHFIFGGGATAYSDLVVGNTQYYHAHNAYLQALFIGGLVGFALFLGMLFSYSHKQYRLRYHAVSALSGAIIGGYLVVAISETMLGPSFFLMLSILAVLPTTAFGDVKLAEAGSVRLAENANRCILRSIFRFD